MFLLYKTYTKRNSISAESALYHIVQYIKTPLNKVFLLSWFYFLLHDILKVWEVSEKTHKKYILSKFILGFK